MPQKANFIVTGCISIHRGLMISPAVFLFLFQCWDRALDSLASSLELKIGFRFWPLALGCVCETARRPGFKSRRVILFRQNIPLSQRLGVFFIPAAKYCQMNAKFNKKWHSQKFNIYTNLACIKRFSTSTEVALALLTHQPLVQIPAPSFLFTA